jgi:membrane peptidoglycan carboxypeptidase
VQGAVQTYFGIDASRLNWQQVALLAGMVQSTSSPNPNANPGSALQRRNMLLDTMIENLPQHADELRAAKAEPLGVLHRPNELPGGCIAAGDRAFICDYVLDYLAAPASAKRRWPAAGT